MGTVPNLTMKTKSKQDLVSRRERDKNLRLKRFMQNGVKIMDPSTTYIDENVQIGRNTVIYPLTVIESNVKIGRDCRVGPFARLRPGTKLANKAEVGNFVEVVRSNIGNKSKVKHLTYIGDTRIEKNVNVGAGTIVANYDGKYKNKTRICNGAFIGSGSILIAPIKIGQSAITGAGAVVTKNKNVPDRSVVVGMPARILKKLSDNKGLSQKVLKRDCPRRPKGVPSEVEGR